MTKREDQIKLLAEHLVDRFIPFSSDRVPPVLNIGDAIGLAAVAIDFLRVGERASKED